MSDFSRGQQIIVLISGSGTNLQALIDACAASSHPKSSSSLPPNTTITRVISNRKAAYGLIRARTASIPTTYHNLLPYTSRYPTTSSSFPSSSSSTTTTTSGPQSSSPSSSSSSVSIEARSHYDHDLASLILMDPPDLVVCAGFMHVLSPSFLHPLSTHQPPVPVINLHPALPGQFNGTDAIGRAWRAFQHSEIAGTGVMVHRVVEEVDAGEPLVVREVEMFVEESLSEFESRMHRVEWEVLVEGVRRALEKTGGQNPKEKKGVVEAQG